MMKNISVSEYTHDNYPRAGWLLNSCITAIEVSHPNGCKALMQYCTDGFLLELCSPWGGGDARLYDECTPWQRIEEGISEFFAKWPLFSSVVLGIIHFAG